MSASRRNRNSWFSRQHDLLKTLVQHARSSVGSIGLLLVIATATFAWAWARWGSEVARHPRFSVSIEKIQTPPQPTWIQSNVIEEVVRDGNLESLSLLDHSTTLKVDRAFALHRWVRRVERVDKQSSRRLIVQLLYRRPAIMVKADPDGFWPVDTEGYLLPPNEFSELQTREFLHVRGVTPSFKKKWLELRERVAFFLHNKQIGCLLTVQVLSPLAWFPAKVFIAPVE